MKGSGRFVKNEKIVYALLVTVSFLLVGTAGYHLLEGYRLLDALYMTVITISTVGFGEVRTLSEGGRIFTMLLILFGLGSIAFLAHAFTEALIEQASSQSLGRKKMLKRVQQLSKHHIICGFGRVGESAAERLYTVGADFVVIESGRERLEAIRELGYYYIEGDATREEVLLDAGIKRADALLALLNSDPDNLFVVLTARELNPTLHIIARTEVASSESRMLRAGADSIISLYGSAGRRVADKIVELHQQETAETDGETPHEGQPYWVEVSPDSELETHVVETANIYLGGFIVGLRRGDNDLLQPPLREQLRLGDRLLVAPNSRSALSPLKHRHRAAGKIILIDDNPVIRRLYTRLFQKAGFDIRTAATGREGFAMVLREKPDGVVLDYQLPDLDGLEVARKIRRHDELQRVKIFMFTGEGDDRTGEAALEAGVDQVVLKSPEAGEIIHIVSSGLGHQ